MTAELFNTMTRKQKLNFIDRETTGLNEPFLGGLLIYPGLILSYQRDCRGKLSSFEILSSQTVSKMLANNTINNQN